MDVLLGQKIKVNQNEYLVLQRIADGACGIVYKVEKITEPAGFYALKIAIDPRQELVEEETRYTSGLNHPALIQIFEGGIVMDGGIYEKQNWPCVLMEWVDGSNLEDWYQAHGMTLKQLCEFLLNSLDVLDYLKTKNLVHTDIKPANIMVTPAHQYKWVDLGSLQQRGSECEKATTVTVAPEVACPLTLYPIVSEKTQIYSLAACVHVMFVENKVDEPWRIKWLRNTYPNPDRYKDHPEAHRLMYLHAFQYWYKGMNPLRPLLNLMLSLNPRERPIISAVRAEVRTVLQKTSQYLLATKVGL